MDMEFKPIGDRVLVRRDETPETTKSGILLPTASQHKPLEGVVVAVGPGYRVASGKYADMRINVGDRVLFARKAGQDVTVNEETLLLLREAEIYGVYES